MMLKNLIPMLNVSNIEKSLQFYENAFGFKVVSAPTSVKEWRWATIRSGHTELMLSESSCQLNLRKGIDPHKETDWPTIFYFYSDDVTELYEHVRSCDYPTTPLEETFYGMHEFSVQDPDGHMLSFGQNLGEKAG